MLVIDSSSRKTWVGVKMAPTELLFGESTEESSRCLFELVPLQLKAAKLKLEEIASIAYCEGPGSMLSIRATVMAIRTWAGIGIQGAKQLFAFTSLELGKELVAASGKFDSGCLIVTDARRNAWNSLPYPSNATQPISIIENDSLENEQRTIVSFDSFLQWTKTNATILELPYQPEIAFADERCLSFLRPVEHASPLNLRVNDYKKWTPKIHSNQTV